MYKLPNVKRNKNEKIIPDIIPKPTYLCTLQEKRSYYRSKHNEVSDGYSLISISCLHGGKCFTVDGYFVNV